MARNLQVANQSHATPAGLVPALYFGAARFDAASDSVTQVMHVTDRGRDYGIVCATPVSVLRQLQCKPGAADPLMLYREILPRARQAFLGKFRRADWSVEDLPTLRLRLRSVDLALAA